MSGGTVASAHVMGTIVTIEVVDTNNDPDAARSACAATCADAVARAFDWFHRVEACCSRFDPNSELRQACDQPGVPVTVSDMLFDLVAFAVAVADASHGAFDPTVGQRMQSLGFDRHYRSGLTAGAYLASSTPVSYRDVELDRGRSTITLRRPMVLDLGAVAKGLAVDLAARELAWFAGFAIDAGGDVCVAGHNQAGDPWSIGIRHPRRDRELVDVIHVSAGAVCTSGDYERAADDAGAGSHHIVDPRTDRSATAVASVTVVAPTAMLADALATAAFVLGPVEGIEWLERQGVDGLILTPALERYSTRGMPSDARASAVFPITQRPTDCHPRGDGRSGLGERHAVAGMAGRR